MKLENKVAIITGGTKGIGYGIAEEYLKEGAKITICSRNAQEGVKAAKELGKLGEVLYLQADVSSIEDNQMLVDETVKKYGRLDIFVANAGINDPDKTHYLHITEEQYDRILGVNLKGLFFGGQLAARQMVKQGQGGAIVNISSVWGIAGGACEAAYSAAKAGLIGLTKALARELGPSGIRVNCVAPGVIDTEMNAIHSKETLDRLAEETPLCRLGKAHEVAAAVYFLASEEASFITGQTLCVDGGFLQR